MILDPLDWDNMPAPLIDVDVVRVAESAKPTKTLHMDVPW
jgi:hypothetical protein